MQTPNEKAEVILIVIKRLLKWLFLAVLVAALILGALLLIVWGHGYITHDLPKSNIHVEVRSDSPVCRDKDFPIFVYVENNSSKTVEYISISPVARVPGHSTNYADFGSNIGTDRILAPGQNMKICYQLPLKSNAPADRELAAYEWSASWFSVRFAD